MGPVKQHINTFNKGMTSDVNIVLQPDGTYRYMKNCSLISQDGNNYVIKDCLGNVKTFSINIPYNSVYTSVGTPPIPIGFISFPDKLVVFSTNDESVDSGGNPTGGYGEIGLIAYEPYGEGIQPLTIAGQYNPGYTPLYHHAGLKFSKYKRIEGFGYIENELIERIYWTDNFQEPRVFNISDPIFTNYIASGSLVIGQDYMVLEGAITHNATNYGPGLTATNVFTASGGGYTNLTGTSPTPKVIDYYPFELLNFNPTCLLGNITFDRYVSGSVICGSKVYFYRLTSNKAPSTSWSYGSSPIPVGTQNTYASGVPYHNFVGAGIVSTPVNSGLAVIVRVENIDTKYDFIELACAEFDQELGVPRLISIVAREAINSTSMLITHTGSLNLGALTIGDITLFPASILKCKTLNTSKNFILAGNITEREELDIDLSAATITEFNYPMNAHYDATSCPLSGMIYSGVSPVTGANPGANTITPFSRWLVISGDNGANTVTYNGTQYTTGQVIVGVTGAGNDSIAFAGTGAVRPCVTRNRYTTTAGARVENAIELKGTNPSNTGFWDYKSAAAHHHVAGVWGNQTYRLGILFYDLKRNPYFVIHLGDKTTLPSVTNGLIRVDEIGNSGNNIYSLNPLLLKVSNIIIPPEIIDKISGFSIVRAERSASVICQGLLTQNSHTAGTPDVYRMGSYIPMSEDDLAVVSKVYSFISPDLLVNVPLKSTVGVVGDKIQRADWVDAYDYGAGVRVRGSGPVASEQVYSKLITPLRADTTDRIATITYWNTVEENQTLADFGSGVTYENKMKIDPAAGTVIEGGCVTGGVDYTLDGFEAVGCEHVVLKINTDFKAYGPSANDYSSVAANAQTEKIIVNYIKPGALSAYGALDNTIYFSTGHYQPITTQVKNDTLSAGNYVFNNIEIGGGDCYVCLADIGYGLWNNAFANKYSYAWTFPCECNSNYNLRRGRKTSNVEMWYTGVAATADNIVFLGAAGQIHFEDYSYNQGYSSENTLVGYPARPSNFVNSSQFQARIRFAGPKFSGEVDDSFRIFGNTDFKDLSANYGRINAIRVKDDRVIVFQDKAINTVPILERQLLSATTGDATTIGTGGVVDRFDVVTSYFGTQHQWSVTETEYGFVCFDMTKKAVVVLSTIGGGVVEVSFVDGLKGYFDEAFIEVIGNQIIDASQILNSPTFSDFSDMPCMGIGITGVYDPKFKMTYLTFKYKGQKKITISGAQVNGFMNKDFTVGFLFNDLQKFFVSFYDWQPAIAHNHNGIVLAANNPKNTTQFLAASGVNTNLSFEPGDTYPVGSDEYVCIASVTLDNANKYPTGAIGASYWSKINTTNQLWVNNQPATLNQTIAPDYQYDKYFGRVVSNEWWLVVNPKSANAFSVLSIEQEGSNVNITDIFTLTAIQSASDTNIKPWNRYYKVIYDKIASTLPLSDRGRITDSYLLIKMIKKNWDSDPTILTGSVKILRWLTSVYEEKR